MCFSATASFTASAVLGILGTISLMRCRTQRARMLAAVPFIFSFQQFAEGVAWLSTMSIVSSATGMRAAQAFIFFAFVFWPIWIPIAVQRYEKKPAVYHWFFTIIGMLVSISGILVLLNQTITITADCCHIVYQNISSFPTLSYAAWMYLLATGGSLLSSSSRIIQWFGVLLILSYGITAFVWEYAFTSIWCFFGALISALIAFYSHKL